MVDEASRQVLVEEVTKKAAQELLRARQNLKRAKYLFGLNCLASSFLIYFFGPMVLWGSLALACANLICYGSFSDDKDKLVDFLKNHQYLLEHKENPEEKNG